LDWDSDGSTSVRFSVGERVNALGFVFSGESLVIVGTVEVHVLFDLSTEVFADIGEDFSVTTFSHEFVREVSVHSRTVPVTFDWFWMPFDHDVVFFANSF
jgi:hypothetical protein